LLFKRSSDAVDCKWITFQIDASSALKRLQDNLRERRQVLH
jgi:hypothetical protein